MFGKIKIRQSDKLFSLYVRRKAKWKCECCGKQYQEGDQGLHASHFWGRRHENTRHDPLNVSAHCFSCHRRFTEDPEAHREWKLRQIGEKEFEILKIRANTYQKKDEFMARLIAKELLKTL